MNRSVVLSWMVIFCLFICGAAAADTVGNMADINLPPGKGVYSAELSDFVSLNAGFDTDFLVKKEFEHDNDNSWDQELKGVYYMAKVGCTLFGRIQPYITGGVSSDMEMEWIADGKAVIAEAGTGPAWGAGIKAYLWEFEGLGLKLFSAASFRTTKADKIHYFSFGGTTGNITEKKFYVLERQVAVGLSRRFVFSSPASGEELSIVPYGGVVFSKTTARVRIVQNEYPLNSGATDVKDNFGVFFGLDFVITDTLSFNAEGRLIDEQSASVGFTGLF